MIKEAMLKEANKLAFVRMQVPIAANAKQEFNNNIISPWHHPMQNHLDKMRNIVNRYMPGTKVRRKVYYK